MSLRRKDDVANLMELVSSGESHSPSRALRGTVYHSSFTTSRREGPECQSMTR